MTPKTFLDAHLPHRLSVLRGFVQVNNHVQAHPEQEPWFHDIFRSAKDGAMVTCRALWQIMGVTAPSQNVTTPATPSDEILRFCKAPFRVAGISITPFTEQEFKALPHHKEVLLVLVAANKCVAHLDEYPDHGVTEQALCEAIADTERQVTLRVKNLIGSQIGAR